MGPTIKHKAVEWLAVNFGVVPNSVYASKFYEPPHSRTRESSWWLEFPISPIDMHGTADIHLLCEKTPMGTEFYYLKIPVEFFQTNSSSFHFRKNDRLSLYLSAEPIDMFVDRRGKGKVSLREFLFRKPLIEEDP